VCASAGARRLLRRVRGAGCGQVVGRLPSWSRFLGIHHVSKSVGQAFEGLGGVCRVAGLVRRAAKWLGGGKRGGGVVVDGRVGRSSVGRRCGAHAGPARTRRCACRWIVQRAPTFVGDDALGGGRVVPSSFFRWCRAHAPRMLRGVCCRVDAAPLAVT